MELEGVSNFKRVGLTAKPSEVYMYLLLTVHNIKPTIGLNATMN